MSSLSAFAAAALFLAMCGSSAGGDCGREPAGSINAFFVGGKSSRDVVATVARVTPQPDIAGFRYDFADGARLTWIAEEPLPVTVGKSYRFVVDYVGGWPDSSGIQIFEGDELLFAGFTDQKLFMHVLKQGIAGFEFSVGAASCSSRGKSDCHDALINLPLTVTHQGESKTLYHGQEAPIGKYTIKALTVQQVKYSKCADAGLPAVSFVIRRVTGDS